MTDILAVPEDPAIKARRQENFKGLLREAILTGFCCGEDAARGEEVKKNPYRMFTPVAAVWDQCYELGYAHAKAAQGPQTALPLPVIPAGRNRLDDFEQVLSDFAERLHKVEDAQALQWAAPAAKGRKKKVLPVESAPLEEVK